MKQPDTMRTVREFSMESRIMLIKSLLDTVLALINEPGPEAAGIRAGLSRDALELMEEIVGVTG